MNAQVAIVPKSSFTKDARKQNTKTCMQKPIYLDNLQNLNKTYMRTNIMISMMTPYIAQVLIQLEEHLTVLVGVNFLHANSFLIDHHTFGNICLE